MWNNKKQQQKMLSLMSNLQTYYHFIEVLTLRFLPLRIYYVKFYNIQSFLGTGDYSLHSSTYSFGNSVFSIHYIYMAQYSAVSFYIWMGHVYRW